MPSYHAMSSGSLIFSCAISSALFRALPKSTSAWSMRILIISAESSLISPSFRQPRPGLSRMARVPVLPGAQSLHQGADIHGFVSSRRSAGAFFRSRHCALLGDCASFQLTASYAARPTAQDQRRLFRKKMAVEPPPQTRFASACGSREGGTCTAPQGTVPLRSGAGLMARTGRTHSPLPLLPPLREMRPR